VWVESCSQQTSEDLLIYFFGVYKILLVQFLSTAVAVNHSQAAELTGKLGEGEVEERIVTVAVGLRIIMTRGCPEEESQSSKIGTSIFFLRHSLCHFD
jgi:hypothetical protein